MPGETAGSWGLMQVLLLAPLLLALLLAPWRALLEVSARQHAFLLCLLVLPVLWLGTIEVGGDARVHLLGMTPVLLIFGWELALVLGYLATAALLFSGQWSVPLATQETALTVLIPLLVSQGVLLAAGRLERTNLFVYLLGVGFLGSTLAMVASLLIGSAWLGWELDHALALLLAFPEGFIGGAIVTALTIFYPSIMRTYDDVKYLGEP